MSTFPILLSVCIALVGFGRYTDAAWGDACSSNTDCAAADNTECFIPTGCVMGTCITCKSGYALSGGSSCYGACVSDVCDCATGYIQGEGHVCRAPVLGETCDLGGNPACIVKGTVTGTADEKAPTCQGTGTGTCTCASTDIELTYNGVAYCSPAAPATLIKTSLTCTTHNACESGMCMECAGAATGAVCVEVSNAGTLSAIQPALIAVFAVISGFAGLLHL